MTLARYAVVDGSGAVQAVVMWDGQSEYDPGSGLSLAAILEGWDVVDGKLAQLPPADSTPPPSSAPRYVPLSTIRDRVTTAGKWTEFAAALDALSSDKRWHLLTLSEGVASDDPDATALLTAVGCDPVAILA